MGHPCHVHMFKNFIWEMEKRGHKTKIVATNKDIVKNLLDLYGLDYQIFGHKNSIIGKALGYLTKSRKIAKIGKEFEADIFLSAGSPYAAKASQICKKPHIAFDDTDIPIMGQKLYKPYTDVICTPSSFRREAGPKEIRYDGFNELAYLHPNWFKPNPGVLKEMGLKKGDKFFVLRFVAWKAHHDMNRFGLNLEQKRKTIGLLEGYGKVFVTSESSLDEEFKKHQIKILPDKIHNILYYATSLVCDSQTMTTESAILGTPAVRCNSFVGQNDMSNFKELENKYGLIYSFNDFGRAFEKIQEMLENKDLKKEWKKKRERLLNDKIDVTKFMIWFVEKYPESFEKMKKEPEYQRRFR